MEIKRLYFQVIHLCTHRDPELDFKTQNNGFIGKIGGDEHWESYRNQELENLNLPYTRETNGTDIYIWGYSFDRKKWDLFLASGFIERFFSSNKRK